VGSKRQPPPAPERLSPLIDAHTHLDACGAQDGDDVRAIVDRAASHVPSGVAGANATDLHIKNVVYGRDYQGTVADVRLAAAGDPCPKCDGGKLVAYRGIEAGHIFVAYQQDVRRQFETVQERLTGEPLVDYVQPFGGGYFYTLPGVTHAADWYGRGLLT